MEACVRGLSSIVWRFWLEALAEWWPIILKIAQCLDIPIMQKKKEKKRKNASIIYLGLLRATWTELFVMDLMHLHLWI